MIVNHESQSCVVFIFSHQYPGYTRRMEVIAEHYLFWLCIPQNLEELKLVGE